jgi:rod shape-determining protein MreB
MGIWDRMTLDVGVDLGTATTLVFVKGRGVLIQEPSVVAVNARTGQILAVGEEARAMSGKTPAHIQVARPLQRGIIADFEVAEKMLKYFFEKIHRDRSMILARPRVVIGVPLDVTEVERKAVGDAVMGAGARQVHLVEGPLAAAVGIGLPIMEPVGNMVVDLGGGTTEFAVISLGGVVTSKSVPLAGDELNKNIVQYARDVFGLLVGEKVAEEVKIQAGSAMALEQPIEVPLRGRDLLTGLPREVVVTDTQVREATSRTIRSLIEHLKSILEVTPPELVADIYRRGIVLTGAGALLRGIDRAFAEGTGLPVRVADDPVSTVARGCGALLDQPKLLADVALPLTDRVRA